MEQQRDILEHTFAQLTEFCHGKRPVGSVAPWWEVSKEGTNMLLDFGIRYGEYAVPAAYLKSVLNQEHRPQQHGTRLSAILVARPGHVDQD